MINVTNKYGKVIKVITCCNFTINIGETICIRDERKTISGKVEDIIHIITVDNLKDTIVASNVYKCVIVLDTE